MSVSPNVILTATALVNLGLMAAAIWVGAKARMNASGWHSMHFGAAVVFGSIFLFSAASLLATDFRMRALRKNAPVPDGTILVATHDKGEAYEWYVLFSPPVFAQDYAKSSFHWDDVIVKGDDIYLGSTDKLMQIHLMVESGSFVLINRGCVDRSDYVPYGGYWLWPSSMKCNPKDRQYEFVLSEAFYKSFLSNAMGEASAAAVVMKYGTASEAFVQAYCAQERLALCPRTVKAVP